MVSARTRLSSVAAMTAVSWRVKPLLNNFLSKTSCTSSPTCSLNSADGEDAFHDLPALSKPRTNHPCFSTKRRWSRYRTPSGLSVSVSVFGMDGLSEAWIMLEDHGRRGGK